MSSINYESPVMIQSIGLNVTIIQARLMELNYNLGNTGIDGIFGKYTESAIKQFQRSKGMAVNGIVDKDTWDILFSNTEGTYSGKNYRNISSVISTTPFGSNITYLQSTTEDIQAVEKTLSTYSNLLEINSYITHLGSGVTMQLPVNPTEISEQISSDWASTQIPGRSSTLMHYNTTSNKSISFSMKLHSDMNEIVLLSQGGSNIRTGIDIEDFVAFLQSLCYPNYSGSGISPPVCKLVIEDVINTRVIVTAVNVTKSGPLRKYVGGKRSGKKSFVLYDVSLSITELPEKVLNANNVSER